MKRSDLQRNGIYKLKDNERVHVALLDYPHNPGPMRIVVTASTDTFIPVGTQWRINTASDLVHRLKAGRWYNFYTQLPGSRKKYHVGLCTKVNDHKAMLDVPGVGECYLWHYEIGEETKAPPKPRVSKETKEGADQLRHKYPWLKKQTDEPPTKKQRRKRITVTHDFP